MITEQKVRDQFRFDKFRALIEKEPWEDDPDGEGQIRTLTLGSIFHATPSGKFYAPFASSNVAGCDGCNGTGKTRSKYKQRLLTKWKNRNKVRKKWIRQYGYARGWPPHIQAKSDKLNRLQLLKDPSCWRCGGCGSAEAHDDEVWRGILEEILNKMDLSLHYVDDMIYAAEYRDKPEDEEEEADDA